MVIYNSLENFNIEGENIMKKKLALMLATITTVATIFTGCGKDVSGNYVADVKLADCMSKDDLDTMSEMGIDMGDITLDVTLELTADKQFTMSFDTTNFKNDFSSLINDNMDKIIDAGLAEAGVTREDITDDVATVMGYDSAEAFFEDVEKSMVDAMDSAYEEMDKEIEAATVTGSYTVAKNSVVFVTKDEGDLGLDKGTIGDDGSISVATEYEGNSFTLDFKLQ